MADAKLTVTAACANVFLFLTTFRRNSATSRLSVKELHAALDVELQAARQRAEAAPGGRALFEQALYPLATTADQVVLTSQWSHKSTWSVNLFETRLFKSAEGGKRFYRIVEEVLADPREEARELAELLFTCMALGFQGQFKSERKEYERHRQLLFDKARLPALGAAPLAPECYGQNLVRPVAKLPTAGVLRMALVAVGVLLLALLAVWFVTSQRQEFVDDLDRAVETR